METGSAGHVTKHGHTGQSGSTGINDERTDSVRTIRGVASDHGNLELLSARLRVIDGHVECGALQKGSAVNVVALLPTEL